MRSADVIIECCPTGSAGWKRLHGLEYMARPLSCQAPGVPDHQRFEAEHDPGRATGIVPDLIGKRVLLSSECLIEEAVQFML